MIRLLANENVAGPSVHLLRAKGMDVLWIVEHSPGIADEQVMALAHKEERTILTHDSDYGELIFKHGHRPRAGVIYFRLHDYVPTDPAEMLLVLIDQGHDFAGRLTVVDALSVRERRY